MFVFKIAGLYLIIVTNYFAMRPVIWLINLIIVTNYFAMRPVIWLIILFIVFKWSYDQ